jgi:hypothetical protein
MNAMIATMIATPRIDAPIAAAAPVESPPLEVFVGLGRVDDVGVDVGVPVSGICDTEVVAVPVGVYTPSISISPITLGKLLLLTSIVENF